MKKIVTAICFLSFSFSLLAQDGTVKDLKSQSSREIKKDPNDTIPKTWRKGGIYSLNISQGSLSNWAAGGDNFTLSINSLLSLYAFYKKDKHSS